MSPEVIKTGTIQKLGYGLLWSSIVTMTVSVAVCEIFSVEEWCDLENRVRVRSRSLEMAPFDKSHMSSYSPSVVWCYLVSITRLIQKTLRRFITVKAHCL